MAWFQAIEPLRDVDLLVALCNDNRDPHLIMSKEKLSPEKADKEGRGVQAWAEGLASKGGDEHPTSEHYEAASQAIDSVRRLDSKLADDSMESATKARQWEDTIGADLYKKLTQLFNRVWTESLEAANRKGKFSRNLALEDTKRKMNDRMKPLFEGKENLLPIAEEIIKDIIDSNTDR